MYTVWLRAQMMMDRRIPVLKGLELWICMRIRNSGQSSTDQAETGKPTTNLVSRDCPG